MSLHLFTKIWDPQLEAGARAGEWEQGRSLLADPSACPDAIARHEGGGGIPAFARTRPDIGRMEDMLPRAAGREHIVVVGNGGSIRNVWALYQALFEGKFPRRLHLLDGTDPSGLLGEMLSGGGRLRAENTLVVPVSKSGNTENVIQEVELLRAKGFPMIAVTEEKPSKLSGIAEAHGLERFPHPEVGGRFTAGQNNALLPLALIEGGVRLVRELDAGFEKANAAMAPERPVEENMGKTLALLLWKAELAGYTELFLPIYCKALSGLGELVVQLVHESYCKAGAGQTVLFAGAPESQHHTNQRYFGGRRNMAGLTVRLGRFAPDPPVTPEVSCGAFLDLEHAGVVAEAERTENPHMVLTADGLSPHDVAALVALWNWAAVYGGLLRGVNPFDQPAVEGSKKTTIEMFENYGSGTRDALGRFVQDAALSL